MLLIKNLLLYLFIAIFIVFFVCLSLNYLGAYKYLHLLKNLILTTHALRHSDACQYQHLENSLHLSVN